VASRGRSYNKYNGAVCSQHIVNIMRVTVCLCGRDTCNGPSLPPREMIEEAHDIIDVDEVVKSLQEQQEQVVHPEPVSSTANAMNLRTFSVENIVITFSVMMMLVKMSTFVSVKEIG